MLAAFIYTTHMFIFYQKLCSSGYKPFDVALIPLMFQLQRLSLFTLTAMSSIGTQHFNRDYLTVLFDLRLQRIIFKQIALMFLLQRIMSS